MQVHMRRLVEVIKDIDGFKEWMVYNSSKKCYHEGEKSYPINMKR